MCRDRLTLTVANGQYAAAMAVGLTLYTLPCRSRLPEQPHQDVQRASLHIHVALGAGPIRAEAPGSGGEAEAFSGEVPCLQSGRRPCLPRLGLWMAAGGGC